MVTIRQVYTYGQIDVWTDDRLRNNHGRRRAPNLEDEDAEINRRAWIDG